MRLRLILSFALVVLITIVSFAWGVRLNTAQTVRTFMLRGGMEGVEDLVDNLEDYYRSHGTWQGSQDLFSKNLGRGAMSGMGGHAEGQSQAGGPGNANTFAGTGGLGQHLRLLDTEGNVLIDNQGQATGVVSRAELAEAISLEMDGQVIGYLLTEGGMTFTSDTSQQLLARLNNVALTAGSIAGGLALLLALLLSHSLLRPVQQLTKAATHLAEGDLSERVAIQGTHELATLGRAFNHMAGSLQQAEHLRRDLTADIAHELRTPLAVQRAHIEALQDGIYDLTLENLQPIEEQNQSLTRLVNDLRTLALADAGQLALERVPTDFAALMERLVSRFDPQAGARGVKITLSSGEIHQTVNLDPQRIEQIINNLLSNALRYTPSGGEIHVQYAVVRYPSQSSHPQNVERSKREARNWVQLTIKDSGPGIPPEALPRLFERFYKADPSRSRLDEGSGTGLGLSIAQKLAQAHGGTLSADNHPDGGAVFTLTLPIA